MGTPRTMSSWTYASIMMGCIWTLGDVIDASIVCGEEKENTFLSYTRMPDADDAGGAV